MPPPPAYLDECMNLALVPALRRRGFIVRSASEADMRGESDAQQVPYASQHGLVLITHSIRHFRRLHDRFSAEDRTHGGIVGLPQSLDLDTVTIRAAMFPDWLGLVGDYRSRFYTWGHVQFRLTQGLRLAGYTDADHKLALGQGDERTLRR